MTTAIPDIMDIQRDRVIQEGEISVTTLSLAQTQTSGRFALDSISLNFYVLVYFKNKVEGKITMLKLQFIFQNA